MKVTKKEMMMAGGKTPKVEFAYGGKVYAKAGAMIPEMAKDPGLLAQMKKEVEKAKK
tara:strand:- start:8 stop:178 length:171 start_codon:yes stop_codon:yes gene_type:complete